VKSSPDDIELLRFVCDEYNSYLKRYNEASHPGLAKQARISPQVPAQHALGNFRRKVEETENTLSSLDFEFVKPLRRGI